MKAKARCRLDFVAPIVEIVMWGDRRNYRAVGLADQLLSAGLLVPEHFPHGRKRISYGGGTGPHWWTLKAIAGGRWEIFFNNPTSQIARLCEQLLAASAELPTPARPFLRLNWAGGC